MPSQTLFVLRNIYALLWDLFSRIKIAFGSFPENNIQFVFILNFAVDNISLLRRFFYCFSKRISEIDTKIFDYLLHVYGHFSHSFILTPLNHSPNARAAP